MRDNDVRKRGREAAQTLPHPEETPVLWTGSGCGGRKLSASCYFSSSQSWRFLNREICKAVRCIKPLRMCFPVHQPDWGRRASSWKSSPGVRFQGILLWDVPGHNGYWRLLSGMRSPFLLGTVTCTRHRAVMGPGTVQLFLFNTQNPVLNSSLHRHILLLVASSPVTWSEVSPALCRS